jgi:hypothetical protein
MLLFTQTAHRADDAKTNTRRPGKTSAPIGIGSSAVSSPFKNPILWEARSRDPFISSEKQEKARVVSYIWDGLLGGG